MPQSRSSTCIRGHRDRRRRRGTWRAGRRALTYATDLFDEATVAAFAQRLRAGARGGRGRSDRCRSVIVSSAERRRAGGGRARNGTRHDVVVRRFVARCVRACRLLATPDAVAVVFEGESLTYARVRGRVNRLARHLVVAGCGSGVAGCGGDAAFGSICWSRCMRW